MSPSEADLRAALRDGDGERPDTDRIVDAAATARRQRRSGLAAVGGVVVLVVGAGTLVAALAGGGGQPAPVASPPYTMYTGPLPTASCPGTFPTVRDPATPSASRLFSGTADSVLICAYGSTPNQPDPASLRLTGREAIELQRSANQGAAAPHNLPCATRLLAATMRLAFYAQEPHGPIAPVVVTSVSLSRCDAALTNGITVRHGWLPPLGLRQRLYALTSDDPSGLPAVRVPPGRVVGSPVR